MYNFINKKDFYNCCALLHAWIREDVMSEGGLSYVISKARNLTSLFAYSNRIKNVTFRDLDEVAKKIINDDKNGGNVYSCLSLSFLIHVLLTCMGTKSIISIGVCQIDGKVFSHAWVETDKRCFDYRFDNRKYRLIKTISIIEE